MWPESSADERVRCAGQPARGDDGGEAPAMNPTMMKLLGDARIQELSSDLSHDSSARGIALLRRHRVAHRRLLGGRS